MKEELSHHSDEMLEKDRTLREKEQVIAELGAMIKTLQANIVFVFFFYLNNRKTSRMKCPIKKTNSYFLFRSLNPSEPHCKAQRIYDR